MAALAARDLVTALVGGQFGGYVMRQAAWQPRGLHVACQPGPRPYATHAMLGNGAGCTWLGSAGELVGGLVALAGVRAG